MPGEIKRRRVPAGKRRAEILAVAGALFARDGYAGTRLDEIAAAAHVTKPVVYRHFESKKSLYLALLEKHREDLPGFLDGGGEEVSREDLPAAAVLRVVLEGWLDYVIENQHAWLMLFRDNTGDEEIQAVRREVTDRARKVLAGFIAVQLGSKIPAEQIEPMAEQLRSGLAGLALWWIDHPETLKPVIVEVAVRMSAPAAAG